MGGETTVANGVTVAVGKVEEVEEVDVEAGVEVDVGEVVVGVELLVPEHATTDKQIPATRSTFLGIFLISLQHSI